MKTVSVEQYNADAVKMTWSNKVTDADVKQSFKEINNLLTVADHPVFVIVDILADPKFPIAATLTGALFGPYRNANLREWLIVGSNNTARFIERTLSSTTGRVIVRWFANEAEVNAYITKMSEEVA